MKLQIELTWYGGLAVDDDDDYKSGPEYHLYDADSGKSLCDNDFGTSEELEAYIAAHYPESERWTPPLFRCHCFLLMNAVYYTKDA